MCYTTASILSSIYIWKKISLIKLHVYSDVHVEDQRYQVKTTVCPPCIHVHCGHAVYCHIYIPQASYKLFDVIVQTTYTIALSLTCTLEAQVLINYYSALPLDLNTSLTCRSNTTTKFKYNEIQHHNYTEIISKCTHNSSLIKILT